MSFVFSLLIVYCFGFCPIVFSLIEGFPTLNRVWSILYYFVFFFDYCSLIFKLKHDACYTLTLPYLSNSLIQNGRDLYFMFLYWEAEVGLFLCTYSGLYICFSSLPRVSTLSMNKENGTCAWCIQLFSDTLLYSMHYKRTLRWTPMSHYNYESYESIRRSLRWNMNV